MPVVPPPSPSPGPITSISGNPIDLRFVGPPDEAGLRVAGRAQPVWLRADGDPPDDPLLHVCLMTYA
jgi:acyl-CoA thioesterase-2